MEPNGFADLLKEAFSDIDFEHPQSDEDTLHTSQTLQDMGEEIDVIGANKLWTSEQDSVETFTAVNDPEENDSSSDNCESESSNELSINTASTFCLLPDEIENQVANMPVAEAQQINYAVGESTSEEGNMPNDLEADVFKTDSTEEEHIETLDIKSEPQASPPMSTECQTPEETSSEENDSSSDNCESEASNELSINTESTFYLTHDEIDNQAVIMPVAEAQQINDAVGESTAEEENMPSDLEADVFETDIAEEEHIEMLDVEYEPQASPSMPTECETPEETSSDENDSSSDNCESEASNGLSINTQSTFYLSHDGIDNQAEKGMMIEAQQLNDAAGECTGEEGNMLSDLEAGVSEKDHTEEERIEELNVEYEPQASSESDEEIPENYSTTQSSHCQSGDIKEDPYLATSPKIADKHYVRDDMKEFTEEDQEQIEESLADYPSDLSHSESEEPAENSRVQPFTLTDISSSDNHGTDRMEESQESPDLDYSFGIQGVKVELISASVDVDLSIQREDEDEDDVQESLINYINTEEDEKNKEDAVDLSDVSDQADDISESSSDDRSSSQEETNFISSVNQEEEINHVTQYNYLTENMLRVDNDFGYMCKNVASDAIDHEKKEHFWESSFPNTSSISYYKDGNSESHHSTKLVQSYTALKDHEASSSETSDNVEDSKNALSEVLWSSSLLMDEDNLRIEEYDWDLTGEGEDLFSNKSGEEENQENEEEALDELDIDESEEGNERDWELEKTRIEAFYRFYGDEAEPEDKVGRNHKVTFCLDEESSPSEREEDSDSSEEEVDSDPHIPEFNTLKPEYISESDDDPLENPYYLERPKMQPKELQPVNVPVKQPPRRNKCLAVLKSILAFGFLTAIGIVSFWWATENMDWIH